MHRQLCKAKPECRKLEIDAFLIKPLQRYVRTWMRVAIVWTHLLVSYFLSLIRVCKYPLLMREMVKYTPHSDPGYEELASISQRVSEVVNSVNERTRQASFQPLPSPLSLNFCLQNNRVGRTCSEVGWNRREFWKSERSGSRDRTSCCQRTGVCGLLVAVTLVFFSCRFVNSFCCLQPFELVNQHRYYITTLDCKQIAPHKKSNALGLNNANVFKQNEVHLFVFKYVFVACVSSSAPSLNHYLLPVQRHSDLCQASTEFAAQVTSRAKISCQARALFWRSCPQLGSGTWRCELDTWFCFFPAKINYFSALTDRFALVHRVKDKVFTFQAESAEERRAFMTGSRASLFGAFCW